MIWNHSSLKWTSVDKSGRKAIKFATLVFFKYMFVLLYCFDFFIQTESLIINEGNYMEPSKKYHKGDLTLFQCPVHPLDGDTFVKILKWVLHNI